mmetsp:Transcript_6184/g.9400  ORF Transcript_6184/g.9400 Transcript_6184/m.9400 type:complete len:406 (+) Transcript_6184:112-1329(+)
MPWTKQPTPPKSPGGASNQYTSGNQSNRIREALEMSKKSYTDSFEREPTLQSGDLVSSESYLQSPSSFQVDGYEQGSDQMRPLSLDNPPPARAPQTPKNKLTDVLGDLNSKRIENFRNDCGAVVNDDRVQTGVIVLIIVNGLMMGLATFTFIAENPKNQNIFAGFDKVFLTTFTIELGLQFIYRGWSLFKDPWLVFDFAIIVMSWSLESIQIIRAFRIFRALRLITKIGPLRDLVMALLEVFPRMAAITMLLSLLFYIFAVLFTTLFKDLPLSKNYFRSLDATLFTLFEMMTMQWADITRECMQYYTWSVIPFFAFVMISGFIVFNLIIAVVCDAVAGIRHSKDEEDETGSNPSEVTVQNQVDDLSGIVHELLRKQYTLQEAVLSLRAELEYKPEPYIAPSSKTD